MAAALTAARRADSLISLSPTRLEATPFVPPASLCLNLF